MKVSIILIFLSYLFKAETAWSQSVSEMPLYPGIVPGSKTSTISEKVTFVNGAVRLSNVVAPTITKYSPQKSNGMAIVICPGGGYGRLAIDHEGAEVAKALNAQGITAFVLKYRLPNDTIMMDKTTGPLQDAQQAIRMVRKQAAASGINPNKIGIMGFSAGGHLASSAATHYSYRADSTLKDTVSTRPDFVILIYPVISFDDSITHRGSKNNLLGKNPSTELIKQFSNELQITKNSPPAFLVHTGDDATVPVANSIRYYQACIENKVPVEMHLYPKGGHGFGMNNKLRVTGGLTG